VFSVTSEAASTVSFQAARQKSGRPDASQPHDGFMALVDSSIAADSGSDGANSTQQPSTSQRGAKDADGADDNRSRPDPASRTLKSASVDRDSSARETSDLNASADPKARAVGRPPAKSARSTDDPESSTETPSSGANNASDPDSPAQQLESSLGTPNAIAVAMPVATILVDIPAANPAIGGAAAPVAIATAAIAPSAPAASVPDVPTAQTNIGADAAGGPSLTAAPPLTDIAPSALAANAVATAASTAAASTGVAQQAVPAAVGKSTAQTDASLTEPELPVTAATALSPVTTAVLGPQLPVSQKTSVSGTSDAKLDKPDPSENSTQVLSAQPNLAQVATANSQGDNDLADAPKSSGTGIASPAPLPAPAVHAHSPVTTAAHELSASTETGSPMTGALPPQLPPAPASSALTGSLTVTAASNAPIPLSGLAVEIAASARSGKSHFEIRLDPANLGRIDVRIDVDRDGQITSHLRVEKPETLSMLRQDAPQLQRALNDAGFKSGDGGLQFSLRDQSSSGRNNGNETSRNAQHLVIRDDDAIPAVVAGRSYGRLLGSSSGVDIRV
jgi:flagellar hook-length control protein FliK